MVIRQSNTFEEFIGGMHKLKGDLQLKAEMTKNLVLDQNLRIESFMSQFTKLESSHNSQIQQFSDLKLSFEKAIKASEDQNKES